MSGTLATESTACEATRLLECYQEAVFPKKVWRLWFPGTVAAYDRRDGFYRIDYDDGDVEGRVHPYFIKPCARNPLLPSAAENELGRAHRLQPGRESDVPSGGCAPRHAEGGEEPWRQRASHSKAAALPAAFDPGAEDEVVVVDDAPSPIAFAHAVDRGSCSKAITPRAATMGMDKDATTAAGVA